MQRVFISGIGVASCLGNDRRTFWKNLTSGVCGIAPLTEHDITGMEVTIGGEVRNMNPDRINVNDLVSTRRMDRASQLPFTRRTRLWTMPASRRVTSGRTPQ